MKKTTKGKGELGRVIRLSDEEARGLAERTFERFKPIYEEFEEWRRKMLEEARKFPGLDRASSSYLPAYTPS